MTHRSAAIVGAGLGGLTAALALLQRGWRVRVFERAPLLREVGAGISLSPGAAAGLASLGLERALLATSAAVPRVLFAHYETGRMLVANSDRPSAEDHGIRSARHIHRADLHAMLSAAVSALDPHALQCNRRLDYLAQHAGGVVAHFGDGSRAEAALLIAADGTRSTVRRQLFDRSAPQFAGQVAFRCLIPRASAQPFMGGGNAVVSIGPSRIFHRYPIRGGSLINVVGIARTDSWQAEGWNTPASVEEFLAVYQGFHADVTGLIRAASAENLIKWGLYVRPPLDRWSRGRVVLLGDAAHPILPFLGLGAALAIEDAVVLARALDAHSAVESAFAAYLNARVARVETVRLQTIRQGEIIQAGTIDIPALNAAPSQDADLFDYDPCTAALQR
ncbi:MAG: FAD-dependent monooxygenase [Steroidobacteraceae bacterium]|jgi:salicylate hydroxylase